MSLPTLYYNGVKFACNVIVTSHNNNKKNNEKNKNIHVTVKLKKSTKTIDDLCSTQLTRNIAST